MVNTIHFNIFNDNSILQCQQQERTEMVFYVKA